MDISTLKTPAFIIALDILKKNIQDMADCCRQQGKQLWPMTKTHKSLEIARMQYAAGVAGFLTGTVDEAECLVEAGFLDIMLAYPIAGRDNLNRLIALAQKARITLTFDGVPAAAQLEPLLEKHCLHMDYLIKIDSGLHRLGVLPENAGSLALSLRQFAHLNLKGIATHPGQVYAAKDPQEVPAIAEMELNALALAKESLSKVGLGATAVATGSTPTAAKVMNSPVITVLRPGNYVFYDNIQVALGIVTKEKCALTVLATIISQPQKDTFIIDAGSKCFGLDTGAHGHSLVNGFGVVKGYSNLMVVGLSEEIGKVKVLGSTSLTVGDKVEIIPNHACSVANMTSYIIGHQRGKVEKVINVDMRGNSRRLGNM